LDLPVRLSEKAVAAQPKSHSDLNTLGAVLYRVGRFEEATRRLNEGIAADAGRALASDYLFLAMAHQRLRRGAEAARWLAEAGARSEGAAPPDTWEDRLEQQLLRREAEALVRPAGGGVRTR